MEVYMKKFMNSFSVRRIIFTILAVISLLLFTGLSLFVHFAKKGLLDQQEADRWSAKKDAAQISCFFTADTEVDSFQMISFTKELEKALTEAGIEKASEDARLYADAYSLQGTIVLTNAKTSVTANAVGVGGDFFLFHPLQLVSGSYLSGDALMKDWIVIDEDMAWQLFGSSDVAGMEIMIGKVPHYVAGVVHREQGHFDRAAGLKNTLVYVSAESLEAYGTTDGISTYELVAPNPVTGFLTNIVKEKFGLDDTKMVVVENSRRYSLIGLINVFSDFGIRSMQDHAIHYPYWENVARAWEDVFCLILIGQFISLLFPAVLLIIAIVSAYKHRTWTLRGIWNTIIDKRDRFMERMRAEKGKWEHF